MAKNPDEDQPMIGNIEAEDQNPQEESRPNVSDASASSSVINEANKKTDSSSSSGEISKRKLSPYAKPWNPNNFRRPDHDCTDAMFSNIEDGEASRPDLYMPVLTSAIDETSKKTVSSSTRKPETGYKNRELSALAPPFIQQQHIRPNLGSPSFSSNPNAVPCDPQNAFQQRPMQVYEPPVLSIRDPQPNFAPCDPQNAFQQRPMDQNIFPRSSPVQAPMPFQMQNPLQAPMPFPMQAPMPFPMQAPMPFPMQNPLQTPMPFQMQNLLQAPMPFPPMQNPVRYPYQRPMANQENQYQHPMANMNELNRQQVLQPDPQTEQPMASMSELNRQQVMQPEPQSTEQKPKETKESDTDSSFQNGRDQEQPK